MPIFTVDARGIRHTDAGVVELALDYQGRRVAMTARLSSTIEEVAALALAQEFPARPSRAFQRRFTIEAHRETGTDPDTGEESQFWVVDSVTHEALPDEAARDEFTALPGWADWTGDDAAQWIEANVTDLASAKTALVGLARAVVLLRDWR
ncbi:MAG: hypothetical protein GY832_25970 [Chloroflexi bacterium]|nr:hypothetical protein [Chloroflexota bacterium]